MKENEEIKMDNCSDYETTLMHSKAYKYILIEYIYIYNAIANKRVMHLMKHGRTERIRKKNRNRFYSEWKLFVKRRIKK